MGKKSKSGVSSNRKSPFPGMDPYLEGPLWSGFHFRAISKALDALDNQLAPRGYFVTPGERMWVTRSDRGVYPDIGVSRLRRPSARRGADLAVLEADEPYFIEPQETEVREPFIEILSAEGERLVTGIELVSPSNKLDSEGRELYQKKHQETRSAGVHLVEIDLTRRGTHVLDVPEMMLGQLPRWDYLVNIGRRSSDRYEVYPVRIRARLPSIRIPLQEGDEDAVLDLQSVFDQAYRSGLYLERIDYRKDPPHPLADDDSAWARQLLKKKGLRK
jgi:hypothetical protein